MSDLRGLEGSEEQERDEYEKTDGALVVDIDGPLARLRQAIEEKNVDRWPMGTTIRWEKVYNNATYLYATIKTPKGWATTAQTFAEMLEYDELVDRLASSTTQNAQVATTWETVG
jgi:hypothetical protein